MASENKELILGVLDDENKTNPDDSNFKNSVIQ